MPSATGNANTRYLSWQPGQPYTLTIERAAGGGWAETADGLRIRTLEAGGDRLDTLMVWSEVFARCDAPPVAVRWSGFRTTTMQGRTVTPVAVHVNYQRRAQGAATTQTALVKGDAVRQITGTKRLVPQDARLPLGTSRR